MQLVTFTLRMTQCVELTKSKRSTLAALVKEAKTSKPQSCDLK